MCLTIRQWMVQLEIALSGVWAVGYRWYWSLWELPLLSLSVPTFGVMKTSRSLLLIGFFIYSWDFTPLSFFSLNILGLITRELSFITFSFLLWQCLWFQVIDRTYCSWLIFLLMDTDGPWIVLILKIWTV